MGNEPRVDRRSVPADQGLRKLLRASRRAAGSLTQRTAAQQAGISAIYWQKIESGAQSSAPADTLAAMFLATGVSPAKLAEEGYPDVAAAMDEIASARPAAVSAEDYLAAIPGASQEEISALQAVWKALRSPRTADPLSRDLGQTSRSTPDSGD